MRSWCTLLLVFALAAPATAAPIGELKRGGIVGLGVVTGTINGFSLKLWPAQMHGLVVHIGAPPVLNALAAHVSYRVHFAPLQEPNSGVAMHLSLGAAFRLRTVFSPGGAFVELGGGVPVGISITVPTWPVELFAEAVPTFAGGVTPPGGGRGFGVDGLFGVRLYP